MVRLTPVEENLFREMTHAGKGSSAREILHAQILINNNDARPDRKKTNTEIAERLHISPTTVSAVRRAYAIDGLDAALRRKTRVTPLVAAKITGDVEAKIIATALGPAPEGHARWTLRLLADYCMEKEEVISISHSGVRNLLNSNQLKPHLSEYWCVPKQNDPLFVASMEDVLGIYQMPSQLLGEVRDRITAHLLTTIPTPRCQSRATAKRSTTSTSVWAPQACSCSPSLSAGGVTCTHFRIGHGSTGPR